MHFLTPKIHILTLKMHFLGIKVHFLAHKKNPKIFSDGFFINLQNAQFYP
jgi:hypothetical protein